MIIVDETWTNSGRRGGEREGYKAGEGGTGREGMRLQGNIGDRCEDKV